MARLLLRALLVLSLAQLPVADDPELVANDGTKVMSEVLETSKPKPKSKPVKVRRKKSISTPKANDYDADRCFSDAGKHLGLIHNKTATAFLDFSRQLNAITSADSVVQAVARGWSWYVDFLAHHVDFMEKEMIAETLQNVIEVHRMGLGPEYAELARINEGLLRYMLDEQLPTRAKHLLIDNILEEDDSEIQGLSVVETLGLCAYASEILDTPTKILYSDLAKKYTVSRRSLRLDKLRRRIEDLVNRRGYDELYDLLTELVSLPFVLPYFPQVLQNTSDLLEWAWEVLGKDWRSRGIPASAVSSHQDWLMSHVPLFTRCFIGCNEDTWHSWDINHFAGVYMVDQLKRRTPKNATLELIAEYVQSLKILGRPHAEWEANQTFLLSKQHDDGSFDGRCNAHECDCYDVVHHLYPVVLGLAQPVLKPKFDPEPDYADLSKLLRYRSIKPEHRIIYMNYTDFERIYGDNPTEWDIALRPYITFIPGDRIRVLQDIDPHTHAEDWELLTAGLIGKVFAIDKSGDMELSFPEIAYTQFVLQKDFDKLELEANSTENRLGERRVAYLTQQQVDLLSRGRGEWKRALRVSIGSVFKRGDHIRIRSTFEPDTYYEEREVLVKGTEGYIYDFYDYEGELDLAFDKLNYSQIVLIDNFDKLERLENEKPRRSRSEL